MREESPELPSVLGRRGEEGGHDNMMSNDVIGSTSKFQLLNMVADPSIWKSLVRKLSVRDQTP